eukprot:6181678-Pleurochrysis_carterae.AAC.1
MSSAGLFLCASTLKRGILRAAAGRLQGQRRCSAKRIEHWKSRRGAALPSPICSQVISLLPTSTPLVTRTARLARDPSKQRRSIVMPTHFAWRPCQISPPKLLAHTRLCGPHHSTPYSRKCGLADPICVCVCAQERKYHVNLVDRSVEATVAPPAVVVVVGPSGVGKTTCAAPH